MKLYNLDKTTLMDVTSLTRDGDNIVIKGSIFGSMPVNCMLTPQEARSVFKLLTPKMVFFLLTFIFRR
ncbi:MAG: hypothetical protein ABWZ40_07495 [Caulobacterales bacterium]